MTTENILMVAELTVAWILYYAGHPFLGGLTAGVAIGTYLQRRTTEFLLYGARRARMKSAARDDDQSPGTIGE